MDPTQFGIGATGVLHPVSGIPGMACAFVPDDLPPRWKWPEDLWPVVVRARAAIASLDGISATLPNPDLLLRPLQNREAQKSSSLEGTVTDPKQQVLFGIDHDQASDRSDKTGAMLEVFNYGEALRLRRRTQDDLPLSLRLIHNLHEVLMTGVQGSDQRPGMFRTTQNQIGRPARFVPPPPNLLMNSLSALERHLHAEKLFDPLVEAFLVHYQFEAIHPFGDGNGRVGRLLLTILISEWCEMSREWLYMSPYFDANKDEYIDRLFRISTHGEWREWIKFCLIGVIHQAEDSKKRCTKLLKLSRDMHNRIETVKGSWRLTVIVEDLFQHPVVRVARLAEKYEITYNTANADVAKLVKVGVLQEIPGQYPKAHYAPEIFNITYAESA